MRSLRTRWTVRGRCRVTEGLSNSRVKTTPYPCLAAPLAGRVQAVAIVLFLHNARKDRIDQTEDVVDDGVLPLRQVNGGAWR